MRMAYCPLHPMPVAIAAAIPDDKKFFETFIEKHQPYAKVAGTKYGKAVAGLSSWAPEVLPAKSRGR